MACNGIALKKVTDLRARGAGRTFEQGTEVHRHKDRVKPRKSRFCHLLHSDSQTLDGEKTTLDFLRADELNGTGQAEVIIMVPLPKLGSQLLGLSKTLMVWPQRPHTRKPNFFLTFKETFAIPISGSFFFVVTFPQMLKEEWNSCYQVNCAYAKLTSTPHSDHLEAVNRPHKSERLLCSALVGLRFHSAFFFKSFSIKMAKER